MSTPGFPCSCAQWPCTGAQTQKNQRGNRHHCSTSMFASLSLSLSLTHATTHMCQRLNSQTVHLLADNHHLGAHSVCSSCQKAKAPRGVTPLSHDPDLTGVQTIMMQKPWQKGSSHFGRRDVRGMGSLLAGFAQNISCNQFSMPHSALLLEL